MTEYDNTKKLSGVPPGRCTAPSRQHRRRGGAAFGPTSDFGGSDAILDRMLSRPRSHPLSNFIEPCLPRRADKPPAGRDSIHEIKHDGFRIMARRDAAGVRLLTRNGHDFAGHATPTPATRRVFSGPPSSRCFEDESRVDGRPHRMYPILTALPALHRADLPDVRCHVRAKEQRSRPIRGRSTECLPILRFFSSSYTLEFSVI